EVRFVGGHPMAGSHKSGFEFASADLFIDGAYAIVPPTPPPATDSKQAVSVPAPTYPAAPPGRGGASRRIPSGSRPDGEAPDQSAAREVAEIARAIGSHPVFLTPEEHDAAVALGSHTPQLLATALAISAAETSNQNDIIGLAGPSFSEIIRLAASRWSV